MNDDERCAPRSSVRSAGAADGLPVPNSPEEARRRSYHCLDALRGVAAIVVLTRHAPAFFGTGLFQASALGVDLFFVMSGFVIAHAYDHRLGGRLSWWRFLQIRVIRLYPLYLLGTGLGALLAAAVAITGLHSAVTGFVWSPRQLLETLGPALLLLPSVPLAALEDALYPLNAVAWSLAFEILINMLYAATFRLWSPRPLLVLMCLAGASLAVCATIFGTLDIGWSWENVAGGAARVLYSFPAGVLIQRLHAAGKLRLKTGWLVPVILSIACFAIPVPAADRSIADVLIILIVFPGICALAVEAVVPDSLVAPFVFLGGTSYAVYALHRPVLSLVNGVAQIAHLRFADHLPWSGLIFLPIFLLVCWTVDFAFDQPVRRMLLRRVRP